MPSMGSHRVRHDWSDLAAAALFINSYFKTYLKINRNFTLKNTKKAESINENQMVSFPSTDLSQDTH